MGESFVQVAPDSTGKLLRTQTSVQGGNTVHEEVMALADSVGNLIGSTGASGAASAMQVALYDSATVALTRNSAANLSAATQTGALMVASPGQWTVVSTPAISLQASASKAAGGAGVRHVCTGIIATMASGTAAPTAANPILVNLRDGASGAGTILAQFYVAVPATTSLVQPPLQLSGLAIFGSANTAMTLEFSALVTSMFQSVTIVGYDVV